MDTKPHFPSPNTHIHYNNTNPHVHRNDREENDKFSAYMARYPPPASTPTNGRYSASVAPAPQGNDLVYPDHRGEDATMTGEGGAGDVNGDQAEREACAEDTGKRKSKKRKRQQEQGEVQEQVEEEPVDTEQQPQQQHHHQKGQKKRKGGNNQNEGHPAGNKKRYRPNQSHIPPAQRTHLQAWHFDYAIEMASGNDDLVAGLELLRTAINLKGGDHANVLVQFHMKRVLAMRTEDEGVDEALDMLSACLSA